MQNKFLKVLLFLSSFNLASTVEQESVDCSNTELVTSIFNEPIDLTFVGTIQIYTNVNINNLTTTKNNDFDTNYIDARLEEEPANNTKSLVIYTTSKFSNYAMEQTSNRITLRITIGCDMGRQRTLIFYQPFKEGNYYSPVFSQSLYELVVPTPLFAGFDLSAFAVISASDDDLINNEIHFSSNDSDIYHIAVSTKSAMSADRKTYFARLTLERIYLSLAAEISFKIMAMDNGSPPLSSEATIILRADSSNSLPPTPRFTQLVYSAALNKNLTLPPLEITLQLATYSAEVNFSKMGLDQQLFRLEQKDNVLEISLLKVLSEADLINKTILEFEIKAENRKLTEFGQTAVRIALPSSKDTFGFSLPLYEGVINEKGKLNMPAIDLNEALSVPQVEFELSGAQQNLFQLQQSTNSLQLKLTEQFRIEDWLEQSYMALNLNATLGKKSATTAIFIKLPILKSTTSILQLQFEKPLYVGRLSSAGELQLEVMNLEINSNEVNNSTQYSLEGDKQELFEVAAQTPQVELRLKRKPSSEELTNNFALLIVLTAINSGRKAVTTVVIELPSVRGREFESIFELVWQTGKLEVNSEDEQQLSLNATKLKQYVEVNEYVFTLEGVDAQYFAVTVNASTKEVNLMLLQPISKELIERETQINILLHAVEITENRIRSSVIIFLELPRKDCFTVLTSTMETPIFSSNSYIFSAKPNQLGSIARIGAKTTASNASISYALSINNEHLAPRISIVSTTGDLQLLSYVSPGIYYFNITAQNVETLAEASVDARLVVDSLIQCDEQQPHVATSLLIKYIEEEKEYKDIMSTSLGECVFQIFSMFPNDKAYVGIDESTKMLTSIAIDREDPIFARMSEPQVQVKLKLNCNSTAQSLPQLQIRTNDNYSLTLNQDIPFTKDITMLTLIIVDINDNAPKFLHPAKPTHLGYPEPSICLELFPEYLTQLKAYDRDVDLNAKIRYSMRPNAHFAIDAVSGIIYPKAQAFQFSTGDVETTLIVTATDRDGSTDGLTVAAVLFVQRLSAAHFTLLTFQTQTRQELHVLLQKLASRTKYDIESIKTATLPGNTTEKGRLRRDISNDGTILQKVWIYAMHADAPVKSEDLKRRLALLSATPNTTLMAETYAEVGLATNSTQNALSLKPWQEHSNAGYIATISVMSLALCLLLGFLLWHFYAQKYCHQHNSAEMSKFKDESEMKAADMMPAKPVKDMAYVEQYLSSLPGPESYANRASITIRGSTTRESYSDDVQRSMQDVTEHVVARNGNALADKDLQPRVQVKFNELVERIHIAVQPQEAAKDLDQQHS